MYHITMCRYGRTFDVNEETFNAGVYGVNLDLWREKNIHKEVLYWMDQVSCVRVCVCNNGLVMQQAEHKLWSLGTQPLLLLVTYHQWSHMDPLWNLDGKGFNPLVHVVMVTVCRTRLAETPSRKI